MICNRLHGGSVRTCGCRLPNPPGGWLQCPPDALGVLARGVAPRISGDCCQDCGTFALMRTGTCLTCAICGSSSGGCS